MTQAEVKELLEEIICLPENELCADCSTIEPQWASVNLGIFLCSRCAGIHRGLGPAVSRVRAVHLDDWSAEDVKWMQSIGNRRSRRFWEYSLPRGARRPDATSSDAQRSTFIRDKYIEKKYKNAKLPESAFNLDSRRPSDNEPAALLHLLSEESRHGTLSLPRDLNMNLSRTSFDSPSSRSSSDLERTLAVLIVPGVTKFGLDFADSFEDDLRDAFNKRLGRIIGPPVNIVCRRVHWAPALTQFQGKLWSRYEGVKLQFKGARQLLMDTVALCRFYCDRKAVSKLYEEIHSLVALAMADFLSETSGKVPLFVVAHGFGAIIAGNYFYDLQRYACESMQETGSGTESMRERVPAGVRAIMGTSPLERGETLTSFFTLGSPLALLSMNERGPSKFDNPLTVPSPDLDKHVSASPSHRGHIGEWLNFYDPDDIVAYSLKPISSEYKKAVSRDIQVRAAHATSSFSALPHHYYFDNHEIPKTIARSLADTYMAIAETRPKLSDKKKSGKWSKLPGSLATGLVDTLADLQLFAPGISGVSK